MNDDSMIVIELRALTSSLSPDHTLDAIIVEDVEGKDESAMLFFAKFTQNQGFMDTPLLMSAPTD